MQQVLRGLAIGLFLLILNGCDESANVSNTSQASFSAVSTTADQTNNSSESIIATIGDKSLTQADIDQSIQLKLYDLEWAKYELRKESLATQIKNNLNPSTDHPKAINISLRPPTPPRLLVDIDGQPTTGPTSAPIILAVFCNYQSIHCGRMQFVYQQLVEAYPDQIRFVYYDFPQGYHRNAGSASNAARCAQQENQFLAFHKALWAHQNELNQNLFLRLSSQLKLPEMRFDECVTEHHFAYQISKNIETAELLGFGNVPVTLVNGLYLNGPKSFDTFRFFIDLELENAKLGSPNQLQSVQQGNEPSLNIAENQQDNSYTVKTNEPVEFEDSLENDIETPPIAGLEYTPRGIVAAKGETPLSRDWLDEQLIYETDLREHFQPAEHEVEGVHVMRLSNIESNDFYQTLGLKEGDVVLRVNDEWVHEAQNNLFAKLEDEQEVSVVLMRKGLPVHLRYAIN